jgi:flagellar protein FliS
MQPQSANENYLRSTVLTASPARLRYLLLERAMTLVSLIKEGRSRDPQRLVDERTITLRDVLGELLSGVGRGGDALAKQVADIYVFLLQELTYAEIEAGMERLNNIEMILEIELETWRQVCESHTRHAVPAPAMNSIPRIVGDSSGTAPLTSSINFSV